MRLEELVEALRAGKSVILKDGGSNDYFYMDVGTGELRDSYNNDVTIKLELESLHADTGMELYEPLPECGIYIRNGYYQCEIYILSTHAYCDIPSEKVAHWYIWSYSNESWAMTNTPDVSCLTLVKSGDIPLDGIPRLSVDIDYPSKVEK